MEEWKQSWVKIELLDTHIGKVLRANRLKEWYFPNWFDKGHFEEFLNRPLSDGEFYKLKWYLNDHSTMPEIVSELVRDYLLDLADDALKEDDQ